MNRVWISYFVYFFLIKWSKQSGRILSLLIGIFDFHCAEGVRILWFSKGVTTSIHLHATGMFWFGPTVLPLGATDSVRGSKFILDWIKMGHVKSLHIQPFFYTGTTVFSISSLKLRTGKLIKETNSFILNMLYNTGLWDQEMKWKSHFCHQACSGVWWGFTLHTVVLWIFSLMWLYIQKL